MRMDFGEHTRKCGSSSHCVVRPTKGAGDRVICGDHLSLLASGYEVVDWRYGKAYYMPRKSRVYARAMRGG